MHVETRSGSLLVVLPDDKFRISCTQAGPNSRFTQYYSTEITPAIFEKEIAPARTFVFYEDVQPLMEKSLIKGGSLENAIVVRGDAVLSKEPLRFEDEFVRHKILDIIGDLALCGHRIHGHVIAVKPGHGANAELARAIVRERAKSMPAVRQPRAFPPGEGGLDINEIMASCRIVIRFCWSTASSASRARRRSRASRRSRSTSHTSSAISPAIRSCRACCRSRRWRRSRAS